MIKQRFEVHVTVAGLGAITHLVRAADVEAVKDRIRAAYARRKITGLIVTLRDVAITEKESANV